MDFVHSNLVNSGSSIYERREILFKKCTIALFILIGFHAIAGEDDKRLDDPGFEKLLKDLDSELTSRNELFKEFKYTPMQVAEEFGQLGGGTVCVLVVIFPAMVLIEYFSRFETQQLVSYGIVDEKNFGLCVGICQIFQLIPLCLFQFTPIKYFMDIGRGWGKRIDDRQNSWLMARRKVSYEKEEKKNSERIRDILYFVISNAEDSASRLHSLTTRVLLASDVYALQRLVKVVQQEKNCSVGVAMSHLIGRGEQGNDSQTLACSICYETLEEMEEGINTLVFFPCSHFFAKTVLKKYSRWIISPLL